MRGQSRVGGNALRGESSKPLYGCRREKRRRATIEGLVFVENCYD